ncbi:hypothetical protein PHMEG_00023033 [Phytophthora megakarya]|uniref:Eukaryotic/viral aspartic protease n=1 Tax=Phytophthora megakarya TaxID=4795 RepID=A0A225VJ21_9STRA|nr:hypothetical protein PHMEG_00023033 [Phytophthora megakarya]
MTPITERSVSFDDSAFLMKPKSSRTRMFGPTLVRQAVWMEFGGELVVPIEPTSTRQVAQDTVMLLRAMGCEPQRFPSDAAFDDWAVADADTALRKWEKKLRTAFGVEKIAPGRQVVDRQALTKHRKKMHRQYVKRTSVWRSHSHDNGRRRDSGLNKDSRGGYRRNSHQRKGRSRDESPYRPRLTLADALSDLVTALDETSTNEDSLGNGEHRNDDSEYEYAANEEQGLVAETNEHQRRVAAEGTFARSNNRRTKGDGNFGNDENHTRYGRQQYGLCAACGGLAHSVHYCYKRCKLCKQVYDAGKCEVFNELLTEPAVNTDYLFAFVGEVKWKHDGNCKGKWRNLGERKTDGSDVVEHEGCLTEALASSVDPCGTHPRNLAQTVKLLSCER